MVRDARLARYEAGHDCQRIPVCTGEDLLEVEPEDRPGGPLALIDQDELRQAEDEHVARPVGQLEHPFSEDGLNGPVDQGRLAHVRRELVCGEARAERVGRLVLRGRDRRLDDPERITAGRIGGARNKRDHRRTIECRKRPFAPPLIPQGRKYGMMRIPDQLDTP